MKSSQKKNLYTSRERKDDSSKCAEVESAAEKGMEGLIYRNIQNTASQQDLLSISQLVGKK